MSIKACDSVSNTATSRLQPWTQSSGPEVHSLSHQRKRARLPRLHQCCRVTRRHVIFANLVIRHRDSECMGRQDVYTTQVVLVVNVLLAYV